MGELPDLTPRCVGRVRAYLEQNVAAPDAEFQRGFSDPVDHPEAGRRPSDSAPDEAPRSPCPGPAALRRIAAMSRLSSANTSGFGGGSPQGRQLSRSASHH